MALPSIMRKLFRNDGYGPLLKPEIIPFATDLASSAADVAASTKWVKDLVSATVYVAQNGDDANNNGLSSDAPVRSFAKAVEIASTVICNNSGVKFVVAAGTYDALNVDSMNVHVELVGSITIDNSSEYSAIRSYRNSYVLITKPSGTNYSITINQTNNYSAIYASNSSIIEFENVDVEANCTNTNFVLRSEINSLVRSTGLLTLKTDSVVHHVISIDYGSVVSSSNTITIQSITANTNISSYGIYIANASSLISYKYSSRTYINFNSAVSHGIYVRACSTLCLGTSNLTIRHTNYAIALSGNSSVYSNDSNITTLQYGNNSTDIISLESCSSFDFYGTNSQLYIFMTNGFRSIVSARGSSVHLNTGTILRVAGVFNSDPNAATLASYGNSAMEFLCSFVNGDADGHNVINTGTKFIASHGGLINIYGRPQSIIPGKNSNSPQSSTYGLFT